MDRQAFLDGWSALHGGARPSHLVKIWLLIVLAISRPLVALGISADAVTLGSLFLAGTTPLLALFGHLAAAAAVVVLSALLDSLDGAVAQLSGNPTRWGALIDALADRVSDAAFGAALWVAGAPSWMALLAIAIGWGHEYCRAKAGALGMTEVGTLTVAERPTRVIVVATFLLAASARPTGSWPSWGAAALTFLGLIGLVHLLNVVHRAFTQAPIAPTESINLALGAPDEF